MIQRCHYPAGAIGHQLLEGLWGWVLPSWGLPDMQKRLAIEKQHFVTLRYLLMRCRWRKSHVAPELKLLTIYCQLDVARSSTIAAQQRCASICTSAAAFHKSHGQGGSRQQHRMHTDLTIDVFGAPLMIVKYSPGGTDLPVRFLVR